MRSCAVCWDTNKSGQICGFWLRTAAIHLSAKTLTQRFCRNKHTIVYLLFSLWCFTVSADNYAITMMENIIPLSSDSLLSVSYL